MKKCGKVQKSMARQRYEKAWESAENCEKVQKGVKKIVSGTVQLGIRMPLMLSHSGQKTEKGISE